MTKTEYSACLKLLKTAVDLMNIAQSELNEYDKTGDIIHSYVGYNHMGQAEGIHQTLVALGFKHPELNKLAERF